MPIHFRSLLLSLPRFPKSLFIMFCILSFMLTSCESEKPQPPAQRKEKTEDTRELTGKQVTILISWTHLGAARKLAQWFNEETGGVVRIIKVEYHDLLNATLKDFKAPFPQLDIFMLWYVHLGKLVEEGVLAPLDIFYKEKFSASDLEDYIPHYLQGHTKYKNSHWAIPFDGDTHVLFYRKSILEKYDLIPPETWDQYLQTTKFITEKEQNNGIFGSAIIGHPTPILVVSSFMNRLGGFGGSLLDEKLRPIVNSPEAVEALTAMVEQARYALPSPLETDFAVSRDAFLQGKVAMAEQWTDIGIMAEDPTQSMIQGDWGVVPVPAEPDVSSYGTISLNAGWVLGLSTKSLNRDVAEKFLAFISRPDITLRLNLIPGGGGIDPVRKSVILSKEFQNFAPEVSSVEEELLKGEPIIWPNSPNMPELLEILSKSIVSALEGRRSAQDALDNCQKKWIKLYEEGI